ncbi:MAG: sulfatase-like hydrolase/transferase [Gemmatimonadaceae bacterium]
MTRRQALESLSMAGMALALPGLRTPVKPNILLIVADDLGYADLSAYGRSDYRTPEIDVLGAQGMRFTDAYSSASTCTPTRVGLMTGQWPARFPEGLQRPMGWVNTQHGLPRDTPTIASQLRTSGYRTALVGKWHLGYLPEFGPLQHGFDEFFGLRSGGVDYFTHTGANGRRDLWEGTASAERVGYLTELLTDRAIEVVSRRDTRPFYLSLHYTAPHWPWEGPEDAHGRADSLPHPFVDGGSPRVFAQMMRSLDRGVGRVLQAVDRAGQRQRTLVIFTSDNGGERYSRNSPFSQGKFTLWEGGIRVPLLVRWPGQTRSGSTSAFPVQSIDLASTLMSVGGAPSSGTDGIDVSTVLRGARQPERMLFWRQPVVRADLPPMRAVRRGPLKYLKVGEQEMLFDLMLDPGERKDLKKAHPASFRELREVCAEWEARTVPAEGGR